MSPSYSLGRQGPESSRRWGDLEDHITRHLEEGNRVSYFAGPIFDVEDKFFNQLKAGVPTSQRRKGMRVPTKFWKIVAWVEEGKLLAAGFVLDQSDEIRKHVAAFIRGGREQELHGLESRPMTTRHHEQCG